MRTAPYNTPGLIEIPLSGGSDYSGDDVTRSNYLILQEALSPYKGFYDLFGDYGTYAIAYNPKELTPAGQTALDDVLSALDAYPVLVDDHHTHLYWELITAEVKNSLPEDIHLYDALRLVFDAGYAHIETGCVVYVDWDKIRKEVTDESRNS